jgi:hypothetical protein
MGWIVVILLAVISFAIVGRCAIKYTRPALFAIVAGRSHQRRPAELQAGGKGALQREGLRRMAIDAATSNSKRRRKWGRETLERLKREDDERGASRRRS